MYDNSEVDTQGRLLKKSWIVRKNDSCVRKLVLSLLGLEAEVPGVFPNPHGMDGHGSEHHQAMGYLCRLLRQFCGAWWLWLVTLGLACRRGPRGLLMKVTEKEKYALGSLAEGHRG